MPYGGLQHFRQALTHHRPWPATVGIFALAFIAGVLMVAAGEWAAGFHLARWAFWLLALLVAFAWTLTDAAHRLAGMGILQ